ncbi:MAG: tripartite tricarboxylate transporter TctB family protein [Rhodospirillales bacterium]|nr:tripartite tricarboxylate transporter TctB family protein [Rhodospirillales bacterium]
MRDEETFKGRIHPDFYFGLVLLIIGTGLLLHTFNDRYDFDLLFGDVSTVFFPRIILVFWVGLSAILIFNGLRGRGATEDRTRLLSVGIPRLAMVFAVIVATVIVLWLVGLLVGGPILMIATGVALGYRRWVLLVPVSLTLPVAIWFALGHVARISLPSGILWD